MSLFPGMSGNNNSNFMLYPEVARSMQRKHNSELEAIALTEELFIFVCFSFGKIVLTLRLDKLGL